MCGIGGILFSKYTQQQLSDKLALLNRQQQHRGPDAQSMHILGPHGLCHQRLALIDLNGGAQPFADAAGRYYLVYNGELYNYKELHSELKDAYSFTTTSDTEVILAAYLRWQEKCLDHFDGMFSFFIWDSLLDIGFAARDPLGVKPFVYHYDAPTFTFASEIKALLPLLDNTPDINEHELAEYLVAPYLSGGGNRSLLKDISYLEPGSYLKIDRRGCTIHQYYSFSWQNTRESEQALTERLANAVETSIRRSLRADVPVGIFLSGGLDSSLIAAIASQAADYRLNAYTICFDTHRKIDFDASTIVNSDDLPFARELAKRLDLSYHEVPAAHVSLETSLQELARINDRIPAWEQEFAQHFLSGAAAADLKAVLVGDAADETNYGYYFLLNRQVNNAPLGLINRFGGQQRQACLHPDLQQRIDPMHYLDDRYRAVVKDAGYEFGKSEDGNILAMSALVCRRWLQRLLHNGDIHTMQFGLEARVPFANRSMLDASVLIPPSLGFKNEIEKYIVRQAANKWLPQTFAWRKKSALPRDPRLAPAYQQILHDLLKEKSDFIKHYLDGKTLAALCQKQTVTDNERMLLFNLVSMINWAKHYAK